MNKKSTQPTKGWVLFYNFFASLRHYICKRTDHTLLNISVRLWLYPARANHLVWLQKILVMLWSHLIWSMYYWIVLHMPSDSILAYTDGWLHRLCQLYQSIPVIVLFIALPNRPSIVSLIISGLLTGNNSMSLGRINKSFLTSDGCKDDFYQLRQLMIDSINQSIYDTLALSSNIT